MTLSTEKNGFFQIPQILTINIPINGINNNDYHELSLAEGSETLFRPGPGLFFSAQKYAFRVTYALLKLLLTVTTLHKPAALNGRFASEQFKPVSHSALPADLHNISYITDKQTVDVYLYLMSACYRKSAAKKYSSINKIYSEIARVRPSVIVVFASRSCQSKFCFVS